MDLKSKYLKYKTKYLQLKKISFTQTGGVKNNKNLKSKSIGRIINKNNNDFAPRSVMTRVTSKAEYQTFQEYLETEGLDKCLPGIKDIETGLSVYFKYFTKTDESEYGVIAIKLELV